MLTVLIGLLKCGTCTTGSDSLTAEAHCHFVGIGIGALNLAASRIRIHGNLFDDSAFFVVEPTQKCTGTEQPTKSAVGKC